MEFKTRISDDPRSPDYWGPGAVRWCDTATFRQLRTGAGLVLQQKHVLTKYAEGSSLERWVDVPIVDEDSAEP